MTLTHLTPESQQKRFREQDSPYFTHVIHRPCHSLEHRCPLQHFLLPTPHPSPVTAHVARACVGGAGGGGGGRGGGGAGGLMAPSSLPNTLIMFVSSCLPSSNRSATLLFPVTLTLDGVTLAGCVTPAEVVSSLSRRRKDGGNSALLGGGFIWGCWATVMTSLASRLSWLLGVTGGGRFLKYKQVLFLE